MRQMFVDNVRNRKRTSVYIATLLPTEVVAPQAATNTRRGQTPLDLHRACPALIPGNHVMLADGWRQVNPAGKSRSPQ